MGVECTGNCSSGTPELVSQIGNFLQNNQEVVQLAVSLRF